MDQAHVEFSERIPGGPRWLHRYALFTAAATWLLLVAGSLVTTTDSGDAVPDWWFLPFSYGTLWPRMVGGIKFEHGHRLIATFVGLLTIGLAVWIRRVESRGFVRKLGLLALLAVVVQGSLGGLRVKLYFPVAVAIVHAGLAQLFFCMVVGLALFTSPSWEAAGKAVGKPSRLRWGCGAITVLLFLQLMLGAVLRHTAAGILAHALLAAGIALVVAIVVTMLLGDHASERRILRSAVTLAVLLLLQLGLGVGTWLVLSGGFERSVTATTGELVVVCGHVTVGALLLACSLVLTIWSCRLLGEGRS